MPTRTEYSHVIGLSTIDPKKDHMVILWELGDARIMHRAMGAARAVGVVARAVCTERWAPRGREPQKIKFFRVELIRNQPKKETVRH